MSFSFHCKINYPPPPPAKKVEASGSKGGFLPLFSFSVSSLNGHNHHASLPGLLGGLTALSTAPRTELRAQQRTRVAVTTIVVVFVPLTEPSWMDSFPGEYGLSHSPKLGPWALSIHFSVKNAIVPQMKWATLGQGFVFARVKRET